MANVQGLQRQGWYLTAEGIEECTENGKSSPDDIIKVALDLDLKQIGERHLPDGLQKCNKTDTVDGPFVLQIQKIRNVTAPKDHEESQAAPQMLKLTLSDGHQSCVALELESIKNLGLNTPPGTKLKLQGKVPVNHGFLMLTNNNVQVLGGHVDKLVENWELKRTLAKHTRSAVGSEGGPPPFIPFGQRRRQDDGNYGRKDDFKSLQGKDKKTPEDTEFEQQRQAIIDEALKSKEGAGQKKFTGGVMSKQDRDIAKIVEMGFSADQANYALRQSNGNVEGAITFLLNQKGSDESSYRDRGSGDRREGDRGRGRGQGGPKGDHDPRQDRGRGRRGKDDEEYGDVPSRPSAPATLFDFLNTKISTKDEPDKDSNDKPGEQRESRSRKSSESEKRSLPNLPPRLIKQQQKREEEKQRQHYGRGSRNDYYEKPPQQNYRDNYRGGGGGYDNRPQYYGNPRSQGPPPQKNSYREYNDSRRNPDQGRPGHNDSNQKGNSGPPYGRRPYDNYEGQYQEIPSSRYQQSTRRRDHQYDKRDNNRDKDYKDKGDREGEKWNEYNSNGQYYGKDSNPQNNQSKQDVRGQAYSNNRQSRPQRGQPPNSGRNQYRNRPGQQIGQGPSPQNTQSQPNVEQDPNQGGKPQNQRSYQQAVTSQSAPQTQSAPQQQQQQQQQPPPPPPQQQQQPQQQQPATQPPPPPSQEVVQYQCIQPQGHVQPNGETYMTQPVQVSQAYITGPAPQLVQQMQEMQMSAVVVSSTSNLNPHSQSFQPENIIYTAPGQMQQVQLSTTGQQGYITIPQQHPLQGDVSSLNRQPRHWKPGDYCMAKYWEDKQYYRAFINGVTPDGSSCYVTFPDYGNTETISVSDIHPVPKQAWETNNIQGPAVPVAVSSVAVQGSVASQLSQQVPGIIVQAHPTGIPMMTGFPTDQPYQGNIGNIEFAAGGGGVPYQTHNVIPNKQNRHSYGKPIPRSRPM